MRNALLLSISFVTLLAAGNTTQLRAQESAPSGVLVKDSRADDGLTLFAPLRHTDTFLVDNDGRVVHTWKGNSNPGNAVYLLDDGSLLRTTRGNSRAFRAGGAGGGIQKIGWDSTLLWEFSHNSDQYLMHHDIEPLPNGNILLVAWEKKTREDAIAAGKDPEMIPESGEIWMDYIIEIKPDGNNGAETVWEWHTWDHLIQDRYEDKKNFGDVAAHPELVDFNLGHRPHSDWTHINAVAYNPELDQIMLSVHNMHELWVIDHSTTTEEAAGHSGGRSGKGGDLLYRWGHPQNYRAGSGDDQQLYTLHDAHWVDPGHPGAGNILIFNNGVRRPDGDYSSVMELTPPKMTANGNYERTDAAWGPQQATWTFAKPDEFYSSRISGAQRLSNGNTLVCSGDQAVIYEVTPEKEVLWKYKNPISDVSGPMGTGPNRQMDGQRPQRPGGPRPDRPGGRNRGGGPERPNNTNGAMFDAHKFQKDSPALAKLTGTEPNQSQPMVEAPSQPAPTDRPERRQRQGRNQGQDPLAGRVGVGSTVPDFENLVVYKPDGTPTNLTDLVPDDGHLVIVTGCLTCPKFLISHRDIEAIAHDYSSSGHPVSFVYLYKSLAHPENGRWIQPFALKERLAQVKAAQKQLQNKVPFVADPMDNSVSTALGGSPNSAYIVQGNGKIDYVSGWADGANLRTAMGDIVGPTETVSTPESIGVPPFSRPYRNTGTVVPRIQVPGTMIALKTETKKSEEEFYVKLRAEVDPSVLQGQDGKMYIGFHLDPVHGVHWNNLVDPVKFTLKAPEGIEITPLIGSGPKVEPATDSDPREFLLDVTNWPTGTPIEFDVIYYACSEKEGWCKPVSQSYMVTLERDRAGGMAQGRWNRGGGQGQRGGRGGDRGMGRGPGSGQDAGQMIARMDRDGDGKIALDEAPERMQQRFEMFDANGDGYLDAAEFQTMFDRRRQREGGGGRPPR